MNGQDRRVGEPAPSGVVSESSEPTPRPLSAAIRRHAVALTNPQSDALARIIKPGVRRLVELFSLRNGTLCATFRGGGYAVLRVYIAPDGGVLENEEASEPDPLGEETEPLLLARDSERLHLGTLMPPGGEPLGASTNRRHQVGPGGTVEGSGIED